MIGAYHTAMRIVLLCLLVGSFAFLEKPVHGFSSQSSTFLVNSVYQRKQQPGHHHSKNNANTLCMKVKIGIVGLPNIGKSTLFNALAQKSIAQAENFPFCTIEPNVAPIAVPDAYLERLGRWANSDKTVNAVMEFVDVAGLVAGASRGEGLGNRFLATIRECDAICHLVRYFEDPDIIHIDGRVDPTQDAEVVNLELVLADIAHIERRLEKTTCRDEERDALEKLLPELQKGIPGRAVGLTPEEEFVIKSMGLLTLKPVIYVFNVDEVDFLLAKEDILANAKRVVSEIQYCDPTKDLYAVVSAKLEAEISLMEDSSEQRKYLEDMGVEIPDDEETTTHKGNGGYLDQMLSYSVLPAMVLELLDLFLVYTGPGVPPERSRTTKAYLYSNKNAPTTSQLAGRLHGDIQRGFIRAEVASAATALEHPSYNAAKDAGVIRGEGKDAVLEGGEVICIKWK